MLTNGTFANECLFLVVRPRRLSVTEWPAAPAAPEEATQRQVACWMKIMSARHGEDRGQQAQSPHGPCSIPTRHAQHPRPWTGAAVITAWGTSRTCPYEPRSWNDSWGRGRCGMRVSSSPTGAAVKPVMPRSSDIRIPAGRCESANRAEERDHRCRATEMMIVSAGSHDGRS